MCESHLFSRWKGRDSGRLKANQNKKKQEPKRKLISPKSQELQDYFFEYNVEENCVTYKEGMNDVN